MKATQFDQPKCILYHYRACADRSDIVSARFVNQKQHTANYAAKHGYQVVAAFEGEGIKDSALGRPGLSTMLRFLDARPDDDPYTVIVADPTRLSRNITDLLELRRTLQSKGASIEATCDYSSAIAQPPVRLELRHAQA